VIEMLTQDYPVTLVCDVLGCARSSYYYRAQQPDETELRAAIEEVATEWPTYGYRRVTAQLRREGRVVNHKRVRRLMGEMDLQIKSTRKTRKTTNSQHHYPRYPNLVGDLEIVRPDQVWVCDITYIRLRYEFVYLAVIMDVFTRCIRGWYLGRSLDQSLTLLPLHRALAHHRAPRIHHSDQGVQYASTAYTQILQDANVQISMAEVGASWENGYAERLLRTVKEEEVDLSDYEDYNDARHQLGRFLDEVYMHKRIHSSLGYLTPAEFESQWLAEQSAEWVAQPAMSECLQFCCSAQGQPQSNRSVAKITLPAKAILEEEQ
jgi:putative transposase